MGALSATNTYNVARTKLCSSDESRRGATTTTHLSMNSSTGETAIVSAAAARRRGRPHECRLSLGDVPGAGAAATVPGRHPGCPSGPRSAVCKVKARRTGRTGWEGRGRGGQGSDSELVTGREEGGQLGKETRVTGRVPGGPSHLCRGHATPCQGPRQGGLTGHIAHGHFRLRNEAKSHLEQP